MCAQLFALLHQLQKRSSRLVWSLVPISSFFHDFLVSLKFTMRCQKKLLLFSVIIHNICSWRSYLYVNILHFLYKTLTSPAFSHQHCTLLKKLFHLFTLNASRMWKCACWWRMRKCHEEFRCMDHTFGWWCVRAWCVKTIFVAKAS